MTPPAHILLAAPASADCPYRDPTRFRGQHLRRAYDGRPADRRGARAELVVAVLLLVPSESTAITGEYVSVAAAVPRSRQCDYVDTTDATSTLHSEKVHQRARAGLEHARNTAPLEPRAVPSGNRTEKGG